MFEDFLDMSEASDDSDQYSRSSTSAVASGKQKVGTEVAILLLTMKSQIKIFHWQTTKLGHHYALDSLFTSLNKINDRWVETFQGKYGRINLKSHTNNLKMQDSSLISPTQYLSKIASILLSVRDSEFNNSSDSDLNNIFDDLLGVIWRTVYLLTLQ